MRQEYASWEETFMRIAEVTAQRSKDDRTQVGACIVGEDNRILSIGYNGTPNGFDDTKFPWRRSEEFLKTKHTYVVHAEANAIFNFAGVRSDLVGSTLYVTHFSCNECAKALAQVGIKKVVYRDLINNTEAMEASKIIFDAVGIEYVQSNVDSLFDDAG